MYICVRARHANPDESIRGVDNTPAYALFLSPDVLRERGFGVLGGIRSVGCRAKGVSGIFLYFQWIIVVYFTL